MKVNLIHYAEYVMSKGEIEEEIVFEIVHRFL